MQKIKEFKVGAMIETTLVVVSATARETKAKKPYLQIDFYDGADTISGNYWDWTSGKIPDKNAIVDVSAQVTEYLGTKQLNVKSLRANTERHLSEFAPESGVDMSDVYKEAYALTTKVSDDFLRNVTLAVLEQLCPLWLKVPGAKSVHHAFVGGTLVHCLAVAKNALAISRLYPDSNDDLCFVGGLLHDLGKLFTYELNGITIQMTDEGQLFEHTFIGAEFIDNFIDNNALMSIPKDYCKVELLKHIILSHHGLLEFGPAVPPICIEAHIVHYADGIDASVQQVIEQSRKVGETKWTDRIYTLGNRPQLTTHYVKEVFLEE